MFKLVLEKAEEPEIKLPTSAGLWKKQEFQKNIYFCFIDYAKAFDFVDHNQLWKIVKEMGIPDHLTCPLRKIYGRRLVINAAVCAGFWAFIFNYGPRVCGGSWGWHGADREPREGTIDS